MMNELNDLSQIGLSTTAHFQLEQLRNDGYFLEMRDAYKFAIGLALSKGETPPEISTKRQTIFSTSTLDTDGSVAAAIKALMPCHEIPPYRWAERLADAGVAMLMEKAKTGGIDISAMLQEADLYSSTSTENTD